MWQRGRLAVPLRADGQVVFLLAQQDRRMWGHVLVLPVPASIIVPAVWEADRGTRGPHSETCSDLRTFRVNLGVRPWEKLLAH